MGRIAGKRCHRIELHPMAQCADGNVRDVAREALQGCHGFGTVMREHAAEAAQRAST